jgi:hypothetical protein
MRYARLSTQVAVIAVVEMSQSSWLVGGVIPGIERQPPALVTTLIRLREPAELEGPDRRR